LAADASSLHMTCDLCRRVLPCRLRRQRPSPASRGPDHSALRMEDGIGVMESLGQRHGARSLADVMVFEGLPEIGSVLRIVLYPGSVDNGRLVVRDSCAISWAEPVAMCGFVALPEVLLVAQVAEFTRWSGLADPWHVHALSRQRQRRGRATGLWGLPGCLIYTRSRCGRGDSRRARFLQTSRRGTRASSGRRGIRSRPARLELQFS